MAFTQEDYDALVVNLNRMHKLRDARSVIATTLGNVKSNVAEIQRLLEVIGDADGLISQDVIDEVTAIGTKFNAGVNSILSAHSGFISGSFEVEE